jgi:two-component system, chemotaxis family, sensor histidine kinase and response regulator PixL
MNHFPRMLRDLSRTYDKSVNLNMLGTDLQVEKAILEKLFDPLLHLLRNAFDHGIEAPEIRRQQGKAEQAQIEIRAFHQDNQTLIEIQDDGQGINLEKIRQRSIELGWLSPTQASTAPPEQLLELIFESGFSTASSVSKLSGRGVGLDVVRSQLRALKGSVTVTSEPGQGTTFRLQFPLTLAVAKLLVCKTGGHSLAFPSDSIEGIVTPEPSQIKQIGNQSFLFWQDQIMPLYQLSTLLEYNYPLPDAPFSKPLTKDSSIQKHTQHLLILRRQGALFALEVGRLVTEQELVIKPFNSRIPSPSYTYGCTILGDGSLIPVVHGAALLEQALTQEPNPEEQSRAGQGLTSLGFPAATPRSLAKSTAIPTVLVIDDSATMRQSLASSLQRGGYHVLQAQDGVEALEILHSNPTVRLVLCDIEMPNMNGFEFLGQYRQSSAIAKIPVAMLTSRSNEKHRRLATTLGAVAYFTKPYVEVEFMQSVRGIMAQDASLERLALLPAC